MMLSSLITGGPCFIGSHTCLMLLETGHQLMVLDNFANSSPEILRRVQELAGHGAGDRLKVVEDDIRSSTELDQTFAFGIDAVLHFAGLKAVGESVAQLLAYWVANVVVSLQLLAAIRTDDCRTLVFSSSATLYGIPEQVPIPYTASVQPINPFSHAKAAVEQMVADPAAIEPGWRIARLGYFNLVGAHPSGRIGEDPNGIPNNLFPFASQVAVERRERLQVFGGDWPTHDGSCVRDYVHVMDLAEGHRAALDLLLAEEPQLLTVNLGSGQGLSVLKVVEAFEQASGPPIPYAVDERRASEAASTAANPSLPTERFDWRTKHYPPQMSRDG